MVFHGFSMVFHGFSMVFHCQLPGKSVRTSPRHLETKAPHVRQRSTRKAMVRGRAMAEFKLVLGEGGGWQLIVSKVGKCGSTSIWGETD